MNITMIGHCTLLIEAGGLRILTDPFFGLHGNLVYARLRPPSQAPEDLADVDAVLVSHTHWDHVDRPFLRSLGATTPVVTPHSGIWLLRLCGARRVIGLVPWESCRLGEFLVTAVPAIHTTVAAGFVVEADGQAVYFAGDTYYHPSMQEIGRRFDLDAALLPVTTYRVPMTMGERGAVRAVQALAPRVVIPVHLALEPRLPFLRTRQSVQGFRDQLRESGAPADIVVLEEGASWQPPPREEAQAEQPRDEAPAVPSPPQGRLRVMAARLAALITRFVDIPAADPDDARRRKVVNILVLLVGLIIVVQIAVVAFLDIAGLPLPAPLDQARYRLQGYIGSAVGVVLCGVIYAVNRRSGWIAGAIFSLVIALAIFGNTPDHPGIASVTFALSISVVCATLFVHSTAGFVMALLGTGIVALVGEITGAGFYLASPFDLFGVALACWFAARSLEQALKEVRTLNVELDQRVQTRTRDLAESLAKTEAILESSADGVIVFDSQGNALVANPASAKLLGLQQEQIAGAAIADLMGDAVAPDDRDSFVQLLTHTHAEQSGLKLRWGSRTLAVSMAPVRSETGGVSGTVAVFRDFTREAEIDKMKSTFVSIASHELRTPLNAILGLAEMVLESGDPLTQGQREALNRILANTGQMLGLANNLLDQAQIEAGRLQLELSHFSPVQLVTGVYGVMDVLARARGLELRTQLSTSLPDSLYGDHQRLHQILINLINNAIKFTDEGCINVRVYMPDTEHWAIDVADTGPGISPQAQAQLFQPFHRGDETTARKAKGAGLGLSIIKQLVDLMGGEIRLQSEIGKGSTFTVVLPLEPQLPASEEEVSG